MTHDAYATPIICACGSGIGADFWPHYHGPTEVMPDGSQMALVVTRTPVKSLGVCCECGASFDRYRVRMVRCRECQDKRNDELCKLRDAKRAERRKAEKALDKTYKRTIL